MNQLARVGEGAHEQDGSTRSRRPRSADGQAPTKLVDSSAALGAHASPISRRGPDQAGRGRGQSAGRDAFQLSCVHHDTTTCSVRITCARCCVARPGTRQARWGPREHRVARYCLKSTSPGSEWVLRISRGFKIKPRRPTSTRSLWLFESITSPKTRIAMRHLPSSGRRRCKDHLPRLRRARGESGRTSRPPGSGRGSRYPRRQRARVGMSF